MLLLIGILLACAALWPYVIWRRTKQYWAARGVPHDPPHPILGSLTFMQKLNPGVFMRQLNDRFQTPYVGIWLFWRPALVINSPEIARRVLVKDADIFRDRLVGSGTEKTDPIGGLNLFTVNDPIWSSVRRRLTPVFTSSKLKSLRNLKLSKAKDIIKRIANDLEQKKELELRSLYADFTTDIIGIAAFGVTLDSTLTGNSPMRTITKDFMKFSIIRGLAWTSIFFLPEVVNWFRFTFFPKDSIIYFRKIYKTIVAQREGQEKGSENQDLVDTLLKINYDDVTDDKEKKVSDDLMIAQAAIFLQGGFDTTAGTLAFMTYELAFQPEMQERIYKELLEAKEKLGGKDFDTMDLSELTYLNCVIKETLRKYPPMGYLDRISNKAYQIDENLSIPAGTTIYVNAIGMHFDPKYFPDPDEFIPERFLPRNKKDIHSHVYMPFGDGPRNCIGKRFALQTILYASSAIFMKYKILPKPGSKKPNQVELEKRSMFIAPGESLYVDFVPRSG